MHFESARPGDAGQSVWAGRMRAREATVELPPAVRRRLMRDHTFVLLIDRHGYTVAQVAEIFEVSRKHVYDRVAAARELSRNLALGQ